MENIKLILLSFCTSAILLGILLWMRPSGHFSKITRYGVAVAFLAVLVAAFFGLAKIKVKKSGAEVSAADFKTTQISVTENMAEYICAAAIKESGLTYKKITVRANILKDNSIVISEVTVVTGENKEKIKAAVTAVIEAQRVIVESG